LNSIKVPYAFSLNIKGIINMIEKKIQNLKSHDCHVLMTHLLDAFASGCIEGDSTGKCSSANCEAMCIPQCNFPEGNQSRRSTMVIE
jgi:hypothetical protein